MKATFVQYEFDLYVINSVVCVAKIKIFVKTKRAVIEKNGAIPADTDARTRRYCGNILVLVL